MRVKNLFDCKKRAKTVDGLVNDPTFKGVQKPRRDKLIDDPIWCMCWHEFTTVKKGQKYRCKVVKTERLKVGEGENAKWVRKTQWLRHQKRFMAYKMKTFRLKVIAWLPYQVWRGGVHTPQIPERMCP